MDKTFRELTIELPTTADKKIDFTFVRNFITAIEKLTIRDVVAYADREIEATEQVTGK